MESSRRQTKGRRVGKRGKQYRRSNNPSRPLSTGPSTGQTSLAINRSNSGNDIFKLPPQPVDVGESDAKLCNHCEDDAELKVSSSPSTINEVDELELSQRLKVEESNISSVKRVANVTKELMIDTTNSAVNIQRNKIPDPSSDSELSTIASTSDTFLTSKGHISPSMTLISAERASHDNLEFRSKVNTIIECLDPPRKSFVDLWKLRELALSRGGLVSAEIRRAAWPKLSGIHSSLEAADEVSRIYLHNAAIFDKVDQDEQGVVLRDIDRSVWHSEIELKRKRDYNGNASRPFTPSPTQFSTAGNNTFKFPDSPNENKNFEDYRSPNPSKRSASSREKEEQNDLALVILSVLQQSAGNLHYYQGFHDLSALVVINMENCGLASCVLKNIGCSHLCDAMSNDFSNMMSLIKMTLFPLIGLLDAELHDFLITSEVEPFFCLSWIITWFSHDVRDLKRASRLFDAFIASHPLFPIYIATAVILHPQNRLVLMSTDCEFAAAHTALAKLASSIPPEYANAETEYDEYLIDEAITIMEKVPPKRLKMLVKYYRKGVLRLLLNEIPSIHMFATPPMWCFSSTAPTERVLREERKIIQQLSRKKHIVRRNTTSDDNPSIPIITELQQDRIFPEPPISCSPLLYRKALIASGMKDIYIKTKPRNGRKIIYSGAAAVVLSVITILNGSFDASSKSNVERAAFLNDDTSSAKVAIEAIDIPSIHENSIKTGTATVDSLVPIDSEFSFKAGPSIKALDDLFLFNQGKLEHESNCIMVEQGTSEVIQISNEDDLSSIGKVTKEKNLNVANKEDSPCNQTYRDVNSITNDSQRRIRDEARKPTRKTERKDRPSWVKAVLNELRNDAEVVFL